MTNTQTPMPSATTQLVAIAKHLVADGWFEETETLYLARKNMRNIEKRDVLLLADHRAFMLQCGYPLETVRVYDRR
jgi:hypothetical protein